MQLANSYLRKNEMSKVITIITCVVLLSASAGYGLTFDQVDVEYWTGTGSNSAMLVVDYGQDSFLFGYRWDGEATGWDMISQIADGGPLDITSVSWGGAYTIEGISYSYNDVLYEAEPDWGNYYWGYWNSVDGLQWDPSNVGMSARQLQDGDWDGWSIEEAVVSYIPLNPPQVPEPTTMLLLAAGSMVLLRQGKRRFA